MGILGELPSDESVIRFVELLRQFRRPEMVEEARREARAGLYMAPQIFDHLLEGAMQILDDLEANLRREELGPQMKLKMQRDALVLGYEFVIALTASAALVSPELIPAENIPTHEEMRTLRSFAKTWKPLGIALSELREKM